jgi:hypothetical protein
MDDATIDAGWHRLRYFAQDFLQLRVEELQHSR